MLLPAKHQQIFSLAIPMILSNVTVPLLGLVDTAVIGHLPQAYYLGGSTVGAMIITFITWLCGFLRMSTTGLSAQALGKNDVSLSLIVLLRGLLVAGLLGLMLVLFQSPYITFGLSMSGGSAQVQFYAEQYAQIRVWGLPAALANIVILGWLLGQHKAKTVMLLLIVTNLVNVVLDVLFVVGFHWQVQGVALATLIAEYSGLVLGLYLISRQLTLPSLPVFDLGKRVYEKLTHVFERSALLAYFTLNRDILIRTLCLEICFVFITFQGARLADEVVAANAILMNFLLLISFGLDGIANAAEALIGKAHGQNQLSLSEQADNIDAIVARCTFWTVIFALCYCLIFTLAGEQFIRLISTIDPVVLEAERYIGWIVLLPIISCWCYLYDGVYIGLTRADVMRNSMIISTFIVFFPMYVLFYNMENHGLWFAFTLFMLSRGVFLMLHYQFRIKKHYQI